MEDKELNYYAPNGNQLYLMEHDDGWRVVDTINGGRIWPDYSMAVLDFEKTKVRFENMVPPEPTILLTQTQVVALWKRWPKERMKSVGILGVHDDLKAFCVLLGAPEAWAEVLVKVVSE